MKERPDNQRLEELLKQEEPYLNNDGFSEQVVESLPKRMRLGWSAKRRIIKTASVFLGVAASMFVLSGLEIEFSVLQTFPPVALMTLSIVGTFVAIAGACIWITSDRA